MTEQLDPPQHDSHDAVIAEALAVIDQALGQMFSRELVSANEVADVLLDVRVRPDDPDAAARAGLTRSPTRSANAAARCVASRSGSATAAASMLMPMSRLPL